MKITFLNFQARIAILLVATSFLIYKDLYSQIDTLPQKQLGFAQFLDNVSKNNLDYAAEKFNVDIAHAEVINAGIFPDPEFSFNFADNSERSMELGRAYAGELGWTLELGGKRKARIAVAQSEKTIAELSLIDYFQNLRSEATLLFLEAMEKKALLEVQKKTYENMQQLSNADSIRHSLGEISQIDAEQSKLEASILKNELWQAETEWNNAFRNLFILMGVNKDSQINEINGSFLNFDKPYQLQYLIETAYNNRIDLGLAKEDIILADKFLQLAKANRKLDLGLSIGIERNTEARNIIAETPAFTSYQVGVAVPLKFSNRRSSELKIAEYENQKKALNIKSLEIEIENEVTEAYYNYNTQLKKVEKYHNTLNTKAQKVLEGKMYSYQRGEISLLEVLDAQRTYNEVIENYYTTLYERAVAFIELQRICGIWETQF